MNSLFFLISNAVAATTTSPRNNCAYCNSVSTYRQLLALPPFARLTVSEYRPLLLSGFISVIKDNENTKYYLGGKLHREGDLPAVEYSNGTKVWYQNGKLHRNSPRGDLPAIEYANGSKMWYRDGKLRRDGDLPAIEYASGTKEWYRDGKLHRENGPMIECENNIKLWYREGNLITKK